MRKSDFIAAIASAFLTVAIVGPAVAVVADNHVLQLETYPDSMKIPHQPSLNPSGGLTVEFWIHSTEPDWGRPISMRPGDSGCYSATSTTGDAACSVTFEVFGCGSLILPLQPCEWRHVAVTADPTTGLAVAYSDGTPIDSLSTCDSLASCEWDITLGNTPLYPATQFTGRLDNVRIWNRALSANEVAYWKGHEITPDNSSSAIGLVGSWSFEDGTTDTMGTSDGILWANAAVVTDNTRPGPMAPVATQWALSAGGNGHWYALLELTGLPQSAEGHFLLAESLGAHTATITSEAENTFCKSMIGLSDPIIGVRKQEGNNQGAWITGEPWSYTDWHWGEGSNYWERYAKLNHLWVPGAAWQDTDLEPASASLLEWESDCNSDGIVDYGQIADGSLEDADSDGVPDCCESGPCCPGDLFHDGIVDGADLGILLSQWGVTGASIADLDSDGSVGGADLTILMSGWGNCP